MIDQRIVTQVAIDEGFRPTPYPDSEGYLTIGYGFLIDPDVKGSGFTREECDVILRMRLEKLAFQELPSAWPSFLAWSGEPMEARRGVLVNMAYNLGVPRLMKFKKMLSAYKRGDFVAAAGHLLDSKYATQVGDRAQRLARQLRTGEWQ